MNDTGNSKMTLREIRCAGARAFFSRHWFGRAIFVTTIFYSLQFVAMCFFAWARQSIGFSSWTDFLQAKANALRSGLGYTVPSRAVALNYTYATSFELFLSLIVSGICLYGAAVFALHMLRGDDTRGYFAGAFDGFARPLGTAWLLFRLQIQILLWGVLFVVPGFVAYYRYRAAWYLKTENPEWSSGKCLAESARLMAGHKARCFALDLSYGGLLILLSMALTVVGCLGGLVPGALGALFSSLYLPIVLCAILCFFCYVFAGRTVFYLGIVSGGDRGGGTAPAAETFNQEENRLK